ncbi:ribosome biogenesis factor YjgA [Thiolapillus sp.]
MKELDEDGLVIRPNKTQLKKELADLQALVMEIMKLGDGDRNKLHLDSQFLDGVALAAKMKPSTGRNRQIKYLVKLLQKQDLEYVRQWFDTRNSKHAEENRRFHVLEQWRDRLVEEGDAALGEFLEQFPQADRQQLRALIRGAVREQSTGKSAGAGRKLFRLLREISADS